MKKIIIILIVFSNTFFCFSDDQEFKFWCKDKINGYIINDTLQKLDLIELSLLVKKNKSKQGPKLMFELYYNDLLCRNCIELKFDEIQEIIEAIAKYKEWRELAIKEQVKVKKEIKKIEYKNFSWKSLYNDKWYHSKNETISINFFSETTDKHVFALYFSKANDINNEFINHSPAMLFILYDDVLDFERLLSKEYLEEQYIIAQKEKEKQKKIEEMFQ